MKRITKIIFLSLLLTILFPSSVLAINRKTVEFGSYPQSEVRDQSVLNILKGKSGIISYAGEKYIAKDGKWYIFEPITWIILSETNGKAFVISEKIIDVCALNKRWTDSDARKWLNETLIDSAFDASEKECIYTTTVNSVGEQVTLDKLFYPSEEELTNAQYGFGGNEDRVALDTAYSGANQTYLTRDTWATFIERYVVAVYGWNGNIVGTMPAYGGYGARPCMNVALSKVQKIEKEKKTEREKAKIKDLTKAAVTLSKTSYKYDGKAKTPSVTVKYNGKKLTSSDYSLKYSNNKYAGTATVEITGKGSYTGTIKKNFTITAGKKIAVTFNGNGGKTSKTKIEVKIGARYGNLPTAKYKGYKFLGWFTAKKGGKKVTNTSYVETPQKQTLYAQWKKESYKITYNLNGGTNSKKNPNAYTISTKTFSLANPSRKGYVFKGWYTDSKLKKSIKKIAKGSTGNKTLYAKWSAVTYNIQFNGNGSVAIKMTAMKSLKYGLGYKLKKNTFKAPAGQEFKEWNTNQRGTGKSFEDMACVSNLTTKNGATIKLYAQWQPIRYNIKYVLPEGVENSLGNPSSYNKIETVKLKKPSSMRGYIFMGWYTSEIGGTRISAINKGSRGNKTLYARFKPITYTVKFNGNGYISNVPAEMTCTYGKQYSVPGERKWNTRTDGTGTIFTGGQSFSNLAFTQGAVVTLHTMEYEKAWFPMQVMSVSQIAYESFSHKDLNAIDICGSDYFFAPFTGRIVNFNRSYGKVIFVSEDKVCYADGRCDYMSLELLHASNLDELENMYKNHTLIAQGTKFYHQGRTGKGGVDDAKYGIHVEVRVAQGIYNTEFPGNVYAFDAFYVNRQKTTIFHNKGIMEAGNYMNREGAPSNWTNLWRYLN